MKPSSYLPIGGFYPMDAQGRVLNRTDSKHLIGPWRELADAVVEAYRETCGERLSGVYVRGSVPAGTAVAGVSDFDGFAVLKWREGEQFQRWGEPDWAREKARDLQKAFPIASKVEMAVCDWRGGDFSHSPQVRDLIATQAFCLWGRDLGRELPPPELSELKRNGRWVEVDWEVFLEAGEGEMEEAARSFIKSLIRGMFEEVMEKEGKYATDFHPCIEILSGLEPAWRVPLQTLVHIFVSPTGRKDELLKVAKPLLEAFLRGLDRD